MERVTRWPFSESQSATAAAIVVLPTPPLPMVRMSPRPAEAIFSSSGMGALNSPIGPIEVGWTRGGGVLCVDPSRPRRVSMPSRLWGRRATRWTGRIDKNRTARSKAFSWRAKKASATASPGEAGWKSPFNIKTCLRIPKASNSPCARAASRSEADWARLTITTNVLAASARLASAAS